MAAPVAIPQHSIFDIISSGDLGEVQRRVEANPHVMEEREAGMQRTPLMWAIWEKQSAIALWLTKHRGDHDVDAENDNGWRAVHYACLCGPVEIAQELVAAGADATAVARSGQWTALMLAARCGHADIVALLLTLPAVRDSIDTINNYNWTALSWACPRGHTAIVQLLLDAGANPTIPQGDDTPLSRATSTNRHNIVALLAHAIAEPQRPRLLFKARSIVDASFAIRKAQHDNRGKPAAEVRHHMVEAAPEYLQGRVAEGKPLLTVVVNEEEEDDDEEEEQEKRAAVLAYTLGMAYGEKGDGLPREVFTELMELMVPRWDAGARRP